MPENRTPLALKAMAQEDPELAARLVLETLPGAAAQIPGKLVYDMDVEGLGDWRVAVADGSAKVTPVADGDSNGKVDFRLKMDPRTLADLATGAGPLGLMLSGRLRVQGKRRRALRLRALAGAQPTMADVVAQGGKIDAGLLYRSLAYLIDPEWTRGHRFVVCYVLEGDEGGRWYVHVGDGERVVVTTEPPEGGADCTFSFSPETYNGLVTGTLTPTDAARFQLTKMEGKTYSGTLLGRWIDRSQGSDDAELEREAQQRELQQRRLGSWGGTTTNGAVPLAASVAGQGDPAHDAEGARRSGGSLLSYEQLYALWERQNWRAHELDFSVDREHWLVTPRASQVDTDLEPRLLLHRRGARDRRPGPVPAGGAERRGGAVPRHPARGRGAPRRVLRPLRLRGDGALGATTCAAACARSSSRCSRPGTRCSTTALREIAERIQAKPDDLDLFVEGIATYHMVIEGVLADDRARR